MFGTFDSWLIYKLTGGVSHMTDVTNASRTMLMNLNTLKWDNDLLDFFEIPREIILPEIKTCTDTFGVCSAVEGFEKVVISGCIGDQQSAAIGHGCFQKGDCKTTYGTGGFLLMNTGNDAIFSNSGLITTVGYQFKNAPPVFALEGSVAVCGSGINWLQTNLQIIASPKHIDAIAGKVEDSGGVYFVPAFTGLFAPYWDSNVRATILGMTLYTNASHVVRALLEGISFQTTEVILAMEKDSDIAVKHLRVDGGVTKSEILLQTQSNILGITIERPIFPELTAKGAAICAGIGFGIWKDPYEIPFHVEHSHIVTPKIDKERVAKQMDKWKKAVKCAQLFE
jgi:glycerol kinase